MMGGAAGTNQPHQTKSLCRNLFAFFFLFELKFRDEGVEVVEKSPGAKSREKPIKRPSLNLS